MFGMKYLPIGSVVLLKGAKKKLMVTGVIHKKDDEEIFLHPFVEIDSNGTNASLIYND